MTSSQRSSNRSANHRRVNSEPGGSLAGVIASHRDTALDSLRRLLITPAGSAMTILVIAIALLLPGLLRQLEVNLETATDSFQDSARITLFLAMELSDQKGRRLSEDLLNRADISVTEYLSQAGALSEFRINSGFGDALDGLEENPLPASITVIPEFQATADIQLLAGELQSLAEVETVRVDLAWIQRLAALRDLISRMGLLLVIILSSAVLLIIGNTIRLSIENRSREIEVVRLVGGTAGFIARPFLYTGLLLGTLGGFTAGLLLLGVEALIARQIDNLLSLYGAELAIQYSGILDLTFSTIAGGALGWLGALIAVQIRIYSSPP